MKKLLQLGQKAFFISIIFTILDYLAHSFIETLAITSYPISIIHGYPLVNYAIVKFLWSVVLITMLLWLFTKIKLVDKNPFIEGLIIIVVTVLSLQIRYTYLGYSTEFNKLNLITHIITLGLSVLIINYYFTED